MATKYADMTKATSYKRCSDTHHPLIIDVGGDKAFQINGGSVHTVNPDKFDVVISFEGSYKGSDKALPWTPGTEFTYRIQDGSAPSSPKNFGKLVEWVAHRLHEGDKVFCGCIGGHGRTGTFLAALVAHMMPGEKDAIQYVRDNYCKKAVESEVQVKFLQKHYGVLKATPSKGTQNWKGTGFMGGTGTLMDMVNTKTDAYYTVDTSWKPGDDWQAPTTRVKNTVHKEHRNRSKARKVNVRVLEPMPTELSIHGDNEDVTNS